MMEILNVLEETYESKRVKEVMGFDEDTTIRMLRGIKHGDYKISVQASYGHYCTPRKTLEDLNGYDSMEMAIIGKNGEFVKVKEIAPDFPRLNEFNDYEDTVYAYVPVDLINDLYLHLNK